MKNSNQSSSNPQNKPAQPGQQKQNQNQPRKPGERENEAREDDAGRSDRF